MADRKHSKTSVESQGNQPRVVNPQVAAAPGEEALEAAAEQAGPIASVQRHDIR